MSGPRRSSRLRLQGALWLAAFASPGFCRAQNPKLSDDFSAMMEWMAQETSQGLAFCAGSTFDSPSELKPWRLQPDISLGSGVIPMDKAKFPKLRVQALADKDPAGALPNHVLFPNLTVHLRLGLPGRMDFGVRGANMTTPKNYKLSEETRGNGQNNTLGLALRRHFFGGASPRLSLGLAYNHAFGNFSFVNEYTNLELAPGFYADSVNTGRLRWDVRSLGANAVLSRSYGKWTPFLGGGYNVMWGSVSGSLHAEWKTSLISPSTGEASDAPTQSQMRVIVGTQRDGGIFNFFLNGELKANGDKAGRIFSVSTGLVAPFRIGAASVAGRENSQRGESRRTSMAGSGRLKLGEAEESARARGPRREAGFLFIR